MRKLSLVEAMDRRPAGVPSLRTRPTCRVALVLVSLVLGGLAFPPAVSAAAVSVGWSQRTPATSPPARDGAAMAFDPGGGGVVLFGSCCKFNFFEIDDETWTWDGTTWTQKTPSTRPPARWAPAMGLRRGHRQGRPLRGPELARPALR
jgi:hypothetical protein